MGESRQLGHFDYWRAQKKRIQYFSLMITGPWKATRAPENFPYPHYADIGNLAWRPRVLEHSRFGNQPVNKIPL